MPASPFRGFFVGNRRDDEGRVKLFENISEPNEVTVSPSYTPVHSRSADLKLKITGRTDAEQAS